MINKVIESYKNLFFSILKIAFTILFCILLSLAVVWPLWLFATKLPNIYTLFVAICFFAIISIFIVKKIKNTYPKILLFTILNIAMICAGICFCVYFILEGQRIFSLLTLIFMFIVTGILRFIFK